MEDKLTEITPFVVSLAVRYYLKMRKPTMYAIDDLISEGNLVVLKELKDGKQPVRSYILQCVKNHFKVLLNKSYRPKAGRFFPDIEKLPNVRCRISPAAGELEVDVTDELTKEQKTYIVRVLDIPNEITTGAKYKKMIQVVRRELNLSIEEERRIRTSLLELKRNG